MATLDTSQQAFEAAKTSFKRNLKDDGLFEDLLKTTSIEEVWEAIERLQAKQDAERRIRRINKIKGFLDKLSAYATAVDTFVQVKPDIMALVWGPIRVLLTWTDNITKFADAVIAAMEQVGDALPQFVDTIKIIGNNDKLRDKLALFYEDILEFYTVAFAFFNMSRPSIFFESVWPKQKAKIAVLISHIERHTISMTNEVSFQHVREEHEARIEALNHFDQQRDAQDMQNFQTLRNLVNPQIYDDRLDWLLNRSSEGSAQWLMREKEFSDWLDVSNLTVRLLWLRGIPGAGKTYLSATTVKAAKARHQTLFVFPSYNQRSSTTAKSILQSLLFQLAFGAKDVQSALVELGERDLVGSTRKVSELFKTLLKGAGPTYVILDGLDEMEAVERRLLLEVFSQLDDCSEAKILISSRPEDDIAKFLETKATSILVHTKNSASIQTYVNRRIQDWMDSTDFVQRAREQIHHLLAPLAANANGMFLYARIILDNAELLTNLEEIERELRVLPEDLDDVYQRIFARINDLSPALQRKAKTILGWIGCAPILMTQQEMEQALDIASDNNSNLSGMASVNFVRICGVAVEVVDETPRFVHFTVSEYIFSRQVADFMDKAEANRSLAKSTLMYLCSGIFDESLSDVEVEANILAGKYRLHWFAFTQWIALARCCVEKSKDLSSYPELHELLCRLSLELRNYRFQGNVSLANDIFRNISSDWPEIGHMVCGVSQFCQDDNQTDWNFTNRYQWVDRDPSIMSSMWARIYASLEALMCGETEHRNPGCYCPTLKRQYGPRIFKCCFPSCCFNRQGFAAQKARNVHVKLENHSRPWKCFAEDCEFAVIGFSSSQSRNAHWGTRHRVPESSSASESDSGLSRDELQVLLFELTKAGNVDGLQRLAPHILTADQRIVAPAILLAARKGSLPMVEVLTEWSTVAEAITSANTLTSGEFNFPREPWPGNQEFYSAIMESGNPDLLLWFLNNLTLELSTEYGWLAGEAVATSSADMYAVWEDFLLDPARGLDIAYPYHSGEPHPVLTRSGEIKSSLSVRDNRAHSVLFSNSAFVAAKKNVFFEARLVQTWHRLINNVLDGKPLHRPFLGWALTCLARSSNPSISLATELLRLGAPIDFPRGPDSDIPKNSSSKSPHQQLQEQAGVHIDTAPYWRIGYRQKQQKGMTALQCALRSTTKQAAQFVRYLLEQGAGPEYAWAKKKVASEPGVALMQKWLGETWEELLKRTEGARLEKERRWRETYNTKALGSNDDDDSEEDDDDEEETEGYEGNDGDERGEPSSGKTEGRTKRRKLDHVSLDEED